MRRRQREGRCLEEALGLHLVQRRVERGECQVDVGVGVDTGNEGAGHAHEVDAVVEHPEAEGEGELRGRARRRFTVEVRPPYPVPAAWAWKRPVSTRDSIVTPAAAERGLALNVPGWKTRRRLFQSGSSRNSMSEMMSARPVTPPPGRPPARILASGVRSGVTPYSACAPPGETRKPVTTSSKMRTVLWRAVAWRRSARKPSRRGSVPQDAPVGSRITAATSPSARRRSASSISFWGMLIVLLRVASGPPAERGTSDSP